MDEYSGFGRADLENLLQLYEHHTAQLQKWIGRASSWIFRLEEDRDAASNRLTECQRALKQIKNLAVTERDPMDAVNRAITIAEQALREGKDD